MPIEAKRIFALKDPQKREDLILEAVMAHIDGHLENPHWAALNLQEDTKGYHVRLHGAGIMTDTIRARLEKAYQDEGWGEVCIYDHHTPGQFVPTNCWMLYLYEKKEEPA